MRTADEHRALIEDYLSGLPLAPELGELEQAMRYTLHGGGKRIRPVLCLATGEAAGAQPHELLPAAAAVELVHTFSLVHDDLPALDDDDVRRGQASAHIRFGEATAILAGDALLAQALDLALSYPSSAVAREVTTAALGMIGGQYLDVTGDGGELARLHALKTGRLFAAAVGSALWIAGVPQAEQEPWRVFADDFGLLFQIVDDILDGDGLAAVNVADAHALAAETEGRVRARLAAIPADTSVLAELVSALKNRAAAR